MRYYSFIKTNMIIQLTGTVLSALIMISLLFWDITPLLGTAPLLAATIAAQLRLISLSNRSDFELCDFKEAESHYLFRKYHVLTAAFAAAAFVLMTVKIIMIF